MYRGADSSKEQESRKYILQYLKGSKEALRKENPQMFEYCERVWKIRNKHMVNKGLPLQYAFFLVCCRETDCVHPLCKSESELPRWFPDGPSISYLPLPDPHLCYGNSVCKKCSGTCHGHYLSPSETILSSLPPIFKPPSIVLKEAFDSRADSTSYLELGRKTLLPVNEVIIWFEHLNTIRENRRKGAIKAADTRRRKQAKTSPPPTVPNPPPTVLIPPPTVPNPPCTVLNHLPTQVGNTPPTVPKSPSVTRDVRESEYQCGVCHMPYQEFTTNSGLVVMCATHGSISHA